MLTDEDRRRLLESRHDIAAADKPETLSPNKGMQSAVAESRDELQNARATLQSATTAVTRERSETDAERANVEHTIGSLVRRYGFIRVKVQDALLNIDPEITISAAEIERRHRLFDRVFRINPADLGRMAQADIIEFAGAVAKSLGTDPDLKPLTHADSFAAAHAAAQNAANELRRETNEDTQAMAALRNARDTFDRAARAHALLVESILVRQNRQEELGQFILARNAAYAARRAARVPVIEELGARDVDKPIPVTQESRTPA